MKAIKFKGQTAVITGAASGMGLVAARALSRLGANVVMCDINSKALKRLSAEINAKRTKGAGETRANAGAFLNDRVLIDLTVASAKNLPKDAQPTAIAAICAAFSSSTSSGKSVQASISAMHSFSFCQ